MTLESASQISNVDRLVAPLFDGPPPSDACAPTTVAHVINNASLDTVCNAQTAETTLLTGIQHFVQAVTNGHDIYATNSLDSPPTLAEDAAVLLSIGVFFTVLTIVTKKHQNRRREKNCCRLQKI